MSTSRHCGPSPQTSAPPLALSSRERGVAVRVQCSDATDDPRVVLCKLTLGRNLHVPLQRLRDGTAFGSLAHRLAEVFGADPRHVTLDLQLGEAHFVAAADLGIEPDPGR